MPTCPSLPLLSDMDVCRAQIIYPADRAISVRYFLALHLQNLVYGRGGSDGTDWEDISGT